MSNFLAPFFQLFMGKNLFFLIYFYIAASALKSCLIKKLKKSKKNSKNFFWIKNVFFRASCFGTFWFQYIEGLSVAPFYSLLEWTVNLKIASYRLNIFLNYYCLHTFTQARARFPSHLQHIYRFYLGCKLLQEASYDYDCCHLVVVVCFQSRGNILVITPVKGDVCKPLRPFLYLIFIVTKRFNIARALVNLIYQVVG